MIATSGILTAPECTKFVCGRAALESAEPLAALIGLLVRGGEHIERSREGRKREGGKKGKGRGKRKEMPLYRLLPTPLM